MALTDNLLYYYTCDDNAASTAVTDATSTQNGVATANTSTLTASGKIDKALNFAGSKRFDVAGAVSSGAKSIAMWINQNAFPGVEAVLYSGVISGREFNIEVNSGGRIFFYNTGSGYMESAVLFDVATWYHIIFTLDGSGNVTIYVDNTSVLTDTGGDTNAHTSFRIGGRASDRYLNGLVCEVGVWNKVLSSDERAELYNSGDGLAYPFGEVASPYTFNMAAALALSTSEESPSVFVQVEPVVLGSSLLIKNVTVTGPTVTPNITGREITTPYGTKGTREINKNYDANDFRIMNLIGERPSQVPTKERALI